MTETETERDQLPTVDVTLASKSFVEFMVSLDLDELDLTREVDCGRDEDLPPRR